VDNGGVARVLSEVADLLEIKGENAFKIRAYRSAADVVATTADPGARMNETQLRELPGIGKDLAARIRELADTGTCAPYAALLEEFPPTILDLLRLQGVGPKTVALYREVIGSAKTVVWNGPMGVFEIDAFAAGTIGVAQAVAAVHGTTIIGGGDSVAAVARAGVADKMTHISTGGGASLEFLGGQTLPGVAALQQI